MPMLLIVATPALLLAWFRPSGKFAIRPTGLGSVVDATPAIALGLAPVLLFIALAWGWWSFAVPRWRLWAYERVGDISELKRRAVAVGLTWPDGHIFEKTEFKSEAPRAGNRRQ